MYKYLFSHDIPAFQRDDFPLNKTRQILCFYERKIVSYVFQDYWLYCSQNSYGM